MRIFYGLVMAYGLGVATPWLWAHRPAILKAAQAVKLDVQNLAGKPK